ncbi:MAG: tetratricopeptide repeat protein [Planctomycetota bacterium]
MKTRPVRSECWLPVGLAALVFVAYLPAWGVTFLWCDDYTIAESPLMDDLDGLARIWKGGETEQYYPLTYSLYWLVVQVAGRSTEVLHGLCILLHVASTVLLFFFLRQLGRRGALLGAALFGLHPLNVETVAWIYELKSALSTFLILLVARWHLRYLTHPCRRQLLLALLFFLLALLSKTATLVYPAAALVLYLCPGRTIPARPRAVVLSLLPFLGLALIAAAGTILYEHTTTGAQGAEWPQAFSERLAIAGKAFWFYILKFILPVRLSFAYEPFPIDRHSLATFLPAALALVSLALPLLACRRFHAARALATALLLYLVTIFPVLGFFNIYMMRYTYVADHLAYLATLGMGPAAALLLATLGTWLEQHLKPRLSPLLATLLLVTLASLTFARARTFHSQELLWREALERGSRNWLALVNLGLIEKERGNTDQASELFERALRIRETAEAHVGLANTWVARGRSNDALPHFRRALELAPDDAANRHSYAVALANAGLFADASAQYSHILESNPADPLALRNREALSQVCATMAEELARLRASVREHPDDAQAHSLLVDHLMALGSWHEAMAAARTALDAVPASVAALEIVARLLATCPEPSLRDEAFALAEQALERAKTLGNATLATELKEKIRHYRSK